MLIIRGENNATRAGVEMIITIEEDTDHARKSAVDITMIIDTVGEAGALGPGIEMKEKEAEETTIITDIEIEI